jgi:hypothetical protein
MAFVAKNTEQKRVVTKLFTSQESSFLIIDCCTYETGILRQII